MSLHLSYYNLKAPKRHYMNTEVKEKLEVTKSNAKKIGKSMRIDGVPEKVHKHLKHYKNRINADRGTNYTLNEAYREYVIEKVKEDLKK
jgi:hypothetical protein